jgi:hypothetical protein
MGRKGKEKKGDEAGEVMGRSTFCNKVMESIQ